MSVSSDIDADRLRRAVRGLSDPPHGVGWNAADLADVLDASVPMRPAAVLVPFVRRDDDLSVLFTLRAGHLRHHAGQVSFPGGGIDATDADAIAAALRETEEETGIVRGDIEPFGYLDAFDTVSGYHVMPVAAFVRGSYSLQMDAGEVDEVFEVPLDFLLQEANLHREQILWQGRARTIHAFQWEGRRIWGATAAMLKNLIDRLEALR
jgi:8-oxo-dGTP pyrophosphatase MutT (NUDIX family)